MLIRVVVGLFLAFVLLRLLGCDPRASGARAEGDPAGGPARLLTGGPR